MPEYIEREAIPLKKFIKTAQMFSDDIICAIGTDFMTQIAESENEELFEIIKAIQEAPTADVAEVKHGEWIFEYKESKMDYEVDGYRCSHCNCIEELQNKKPFCPNCGAKMDGKEDV